MKIKLLNNGGFSGLEAVMFPVVVNGTPTGRDVVSVLARELYRIGAEENYFEGNTESWSFDIGTECELVQQLLHVRAVRQSDEYSCAHCGKSWDVSDIDPPECTVQPHITGGRH